MPRFDARSRWYSGMNSTRGLRWLAEFLAPMQDAEFFEGGLKHPIGKCTSSSPAVHAARLTNSRPGDGQTIWRYRAADEIWSESFKAVKAPTSSAACADSLMSRVQILFSRRRENVPRRGSHRRPSLRSSACA